MEFKKVAKIPKPAQRVAVMSERTRGVFLEMSSLLQGDIVHLDINSLPIIDEEKKRTQQQYAGSVDTVKEKLEGTFKKHQRGFDLYIERIE